MVWQTVKEEQVGGQVRGKGTALKCKWSNLSGRYRMLTIKFCKLFCLLKMFVIKSYRQKLWGIANAWKINSQLRQNESTEEEKKTAQKLTERESQKKKKKVLGSE